MRILICNGAWAPNIGNAFVNIGTEIIMKKAFDGCEIIYSTDVANRWFFNEVGDGEFKNNLFLCSSYIKPDLVVWGGMMLTKTMVDVQGDIFASFSQRGIPVFFIGAGMDEYTEDEADYVAQYLKNIDRLAIITRDDKTYAFLHRYDFLEFKVAKGIDAAFFLSELTVPDLEIDPYVISCFDRIPRPYIDSRGMRIIETHHDSGNELPTRYVNRDNTLVSELPYDYLTLYKNAQMIFSERIHACIAGMAYGRPVKLYADSPRAALFNKVLKDGEKQICERIVSADTNLLQDEKNKVISNVKTMWGGAKTRSI